MKPQIAGRIRRNIQTFLDLGASVTVVNTVPRVDFFQGLEHPRLAADFVEVSSLAVRYQARMTRQKNERQARWDREKLEKAEKAKLPKKVAPDWMMREGRIPETLLRAWTSPKGRETRQRADKQWKQADRRLTRFVRATRKKRDLTIRDQLKKIHRVNRFEEFWRLSPARIAEHQPDIVVSSDLPGLVGASIAARRLGVPHLHDCHELYLESTSFVTYEKKVLQPIEKMYMRRADSVVVVNETIRDEYEKRYGVRGTVLRNAAPAVSEEVRSRPVDLRGMAGVPHEAQVVLYQGGLVAGRGLDVLIRAAQFLPDGAHLVLIGKGGEQEALEALVEELNVSDRVHFLPAVEPGELPALTAAADVGVIPYQPVSLNNRFALPNKVFEYTGAGIPFVAADLPELRRVADTERCGEVYDPYDPQQLAAAISTILDPGRYSHYRTRADAFGRSNTWETEKKILEVEVRRLGVTIPER